MLQQIARLMSVNKEKVGNTKSQTCILCQKHQTGQSNEGGKSKKSNGDTSSSLEKIPGSVVGGIQLNNDIE